ncbi:MAG TPA: thiamine-phosphate kinase [Pirellulales bacterium]|jgi:thiamine-monophosphate kinase|nr:thiamine-phosphate kinase [Pirellulales bacterium]
METEFLDWLRERLPSHPNLRLGIGDDAAVLDLGMRPECVVTVDLITEGVDFRLSETSPQRIGHKALAVNLSDLAAMAARPLAAVVALALPRVGALETAVGLYQGLLPLAERYNLAIAGGDTNTWDGPLVVSVTALGQVTQRGVLRRAGARPGDALVVTGEFGGSILGKHLDFEPRVREALALHERYELHAGMDVSDGLSLDLSRLAEASGCGAVLYLSRVPVAKEAYELARLRGDSVSPLDHALGDGEDFELLLAVPPLDALRVTTDKSIGTPLTTVGQFVEQPGLWQLHPSGELLPLEPRGYLH